MTRKQRRYIKNREEIIFKQCERHRQDLKNPLYKQLRRVYWNISNTKVAISLHTEKLEFFKDRLKKLMKDLEEAKFFWGAERVKIGRVRHGNKNLVVR